MKNNEGIDNKKVNELVSLSKKILKLAYIFLIIVGVYSLTILLKEWKIAGFIKTILTILSPLFIGLFICWLFNPVVNYFHKKGFKRIYSTALVYLIFLGIIAAFLGILLPVLSSQVNEFAKTVPSIFDSMKGFFDGFFNNLKGIQGLDVENIKNNLFNNIEKYGTSLTSSLPSTIVGSISSLISGIGVFIVGLIIGFYMLISFNTLDDAFEFIPKKARTDTRKIVTDINKALRLFVKGALIDSSLVFIVSSIALWIVGLKAPLLFGLFCGLTNVIPYAGPYIGGAPAVIVGFSQSPTIGFLTLLVIVVIQFVEGNFFQPVIMSKTTKLHPVTIMIGLLLFGYFFGIIGMIVSTPIIATLKVIINYFDKKYNFLKFSENTLKEK